MHTTHRMAECVIHTSGWFVKTPQSPFKQQTATPVLLTLSPPQQARPSQTHRPNSWSMLLEAMLDPPQLCMLPSVSSAVMRKGGWCR